MTLNEQVVIVTGGGRGLGREFAQALAGAGAAVAVVARSEDQLLETVELIERTDGRAIAITADVADRNAVEKMVVEVVRQLGPVDMLVNNAGINHAQGVAWEADPEDWWRELEINLRGPFLCARAVLPGMIERRQGRIINVASAAGIWPWPYMSAYATSKAALVRLSEILALEAKEHGISVFAIHPGTVRTQMNENLLESNVVRERAPTIKQWYQDVIDESRDAPPERSAELVLRLASGQADALSGCYISIDDDVAELVRRAAEIERDGRYTLRLNT